MPVFPGCRIPTTAIFVMALSMLTACDMGFMRVSHRDAEGNQTDVNPAVTGEETPGGSTSDLNNADDPKLGEPDALPPELHRATVGTRCVDGAEVEYLVLSTSKEECADHALAIDSVFTTGEAVDAVVLELDEAPGMKSVRYCQTEDSCQDIELEVSVDVSNDAVSGTWSGAPTGVTKTVDFAASPCDYDQVVDPLPGETLAAGIAIDEVSVYQGVKIPIVSDGVAVSERNGPIVAGRPGVVRVFVNPQPDWVQRDILVRLTIGDLVKEVRLTPMAASSETATDSTANFEFMASELPSNADYSVEILETQSCGGPRDGDSSSARVPEVNTLSLESEAVGTMRITLVPIQYQADGSNRVPDVSQAAVASFREAAFARYPVESLEITVRDPVETSVELSPTGGGFGQLLNLCLNTRAQDNPDPDVFYYCLVQPAQTRQAFCGGGCVAGVAPLNVDNRVDQRAGMGIGFNGGGADTFVHETGHALGRPHAPCGGAAQTDPNFPYAQGGIGSWGYNIVNGQLLQPNSHRDFMGYCSPNWVSDYTFSRLFERLDSILGTQMFLSETAPVSWRTAVLQDGELSWGANRTLRVRPSGQQVDATLRDVDGGVIGQVSVYVGEVADIDAHLITVEDSSVGGHSIEIPGLGEFLVVR